jgi:hypothetical protein
MLMSRYKVLPLPIDFQDDFAELYYSDPWDRPNKIDPIFNRDGMYLDRKKNICWVETKHGCWIVGDSGDFDQELLYRANDENILHPDVIKAFKVLESHNLLTMDLKRKWWRSRDAEQLRDTYRQARAWRLRTLGK